MNRRRMLINRNPIENKLSSNLAESAKKASGLKLSKILAKTLANSKGISLIEIVLASAIIGIVFVSFLSLFSMSSSTTAFSGEKTAMMMAAQDLMEQATRVEGFPNLNADGLPQAVAIRDAQYAARFDAVRTVVLEDPTLNQGKLKKVIIQVKEKSDTHFEKGVMLVTLVGDMR